MSDESLKRGLADSAAGRVSDLGDFSQYADDPLTEEELIEDLDDVVLACEYCNGTQEVRFQEDPYDADVNEDHTKHFICETCRQERSDDI